MKKNFKKLGVLLTTAALCVSVLPITSVSAANFSQEYTPEENVFSIGGKSYILLDSEGEGADREYLILSKDFTGPRYWGVLADDAANAYNRYKQTFDVSGTDTNHVGYWLNTEYLNNQLPTSGALKMADYIPMSAWNTEAGCADDCKNDYVVNAKVVLPSKTELTKYESKIGYHDASEQAFWWTRTPWKPSWAPDKADKGAIVVVAITFESNKQRGNFRRSNGLKGDVRPMFRLNNDFFDDMAIDLMSAGENVLDMIRNNYTDEQLSDIYSSEALKWLRGGLGEEDKPVLDLVTLEGTGDTTTIMNTNAVLGTNAVSVKYQWQTSTDGTTFTDISGATENQLYITSAYASRNGEVGNAVTRYLRVKATPVSQSGILGDAVYSDVKQMPCGIGPTAQTWAKLGSDGKRTPKVGLAVTDEKYIFNLAEAADGEGKKFILVNNEADGSYFVMGYDIYSKRVAFDANTAVSKRQKYDPTVATNIGYYIENELWKGGTVGSERVITLDLPQAIKDHAVLKTWRTEKGNNNNNAKSDYAFDAYVTLLSATEWEQYKDIIGVNDNADKTVKDWWLRSPLGLYETAGASDEGARGILCFRPTAAGINMASVEPGWAGMAIRPVMYLNKDFFKDVKIDVYSVGSVVKSIMTTAYTEQELARAGYTSSELNILYDRVDRPEITFVSISGEKLFGGRVIESAVTFDEKTASVRYQWQESADGTSFANIANANEESFKITNQGGKYVRLAVTPVNADGVSGDTAYSNALKIEAALAKMTKQFINDSGKVKATTDAADMFTVGSRKFIMLDANDSGEFFVMTYDAYGKSVFDPQNTQKYDIEDPTNIAYYVNNTVLNGTDSNYPLLSDMIKNHLVEKIWKVEPGTAAGNTPYESSFESKLALISATEYMKYADKIGVVDEMAGAWATRTAGTTWTAADYNNALCFVGGRAEEWDNDTGSFFTRPVMYLDKDFFLDAKIPAAELGANVIEIMKRVYTPAELKTVYSKNDLNVYFGISDFEIKNTSAVKEGNAWKVTADAVSASADPVNVLLIAAVYDETGEILKGIASEAVEISGDLINKTLTVGASDINEKDIIKVMLWDSWKTIVPLCDEAVINR